MLVVPTIKAEVAFAYETDGFKALAEDVHEAGGTVEEIVGKQALISYNGERVVVPMGYAVLFSRGHNRLMSLDKFNELYMELKDGEVVDYDEKLAELESRLSKLEKTRTKGSKVASE